MVDWYRVQRQMDRERARERKGFNLIGFNFPDKRYKWQGDGWVMPEPIYRTCPMHPGRILFQKKDDKDTLQCPECGSCFSTQELTGTEETVKGTHKSKPAIIQGNNKKQKKYYDSFGVLITDPTLINDIKHGKNVIYYNEQKSGEDKPHVVKK
jgi:hypothetical protein